jgi:hypothetical protein
MSVDAGQIRSHERREPRFFPFIGFPHTEHAPLFATHGVTDHHQGTAQVTITKYACFAVIPPRIVHLEGGTCKDVGGIGEVEPAFLERLSAFVRIIRKAHDFRGRVLAGEGAVDRARP